MAVITISRQIGSMGDEIASRLCQILGYQQFDKRLIVQAAAESGLTEQEAIDYSDENHKVRNFIDRLFNRSTTVMNARIWKEDADGLRTFEEVPLSEEAVVALVEHAIRSAHRTGNVVIVGRGGQVILQDKEDVVHIRVEAPLEIRIQRIKEEFKHSRQAFHADIELRRDAQDWIIGRDAASTDYLRRFYDVDWADPNLYHLTINTDKVGVEAAAEIIAHMVTVAETEKKGEESAVS
jgi:cytidylate kinase